LLIVYYNFFGSSVYVSSAIHSQLKKASTPPRFIPLYIISQDILNSGSLESYNYNKGHSVIKLFYFPENKDSCS